MIEIKLTQGKVAVIDDADWDLVRGFKWRAWTSPRLKTYYAMTDVRRENGSKTTVMMHRLLLGLTDPNIQADHRDRNGLNNRRENLRACSNGENKRNRDAQVNNTSGYKGVTFHKKTGKLKASIKLNRKQIHLGYFDTKEAAHAAYCAAASELHGDFANYGIPYAKKWSKPVQESMLD